MNIWLASLKLAEDRHDRDRYEGRDWSRLTAQEKAEEILVCHSELVAEVRR